MDDVEDHAAFDPSVYLGLPPGSDALMDAIARKMASAMRQPLAPGDPRRHHFIPKFFQRRFAKDDQLIRVRLDNRTERRPANVNDIAVVKDLNTTIDSDVGTTVAVERLLGVIDTEAVQPMERLAYGVLYPPQRKDRLALSLWLGMLHVRSPHTRRVMEALADQAIKMQLALIHDADDAREHLRNASGEDPTQDDVEQLLAGLAALDDFEFVPHQNELIEHMLRLGVESAPVFLRRYWSLAKFREPGLMLSDNPMVLYRAPQNRNPFCGVGIATADEIWMPLDRSTALMLHSDREVGERIVDGDALGFGVDAFNAAVVAFAREEVYCHPEDVDGLDRLDLKSERTDSPLMSLTGGDWMRTTTDGINSAPTRRQPRRFRRD